ncbi:MAG TPA: Ig-like domain-containing protein [Anaerolineales bacterium]|jgi:fibronectin type 3 domain-containing protein
MKTLSVHNIARFQAFIKFLLIAAVLVNALAMPFQTSLVKAASGCATGGPLSGAYTVTVCFSSPADGAVLSGTQTISVSTSTTGANPGFARMIFYLGGEYLLMDFQSPYTFSVPTGKWVDGARTLEVEAFMKDGYTSPRASLNVTFQNGVSTPPVNNNSFTIRTGTTPPAGAPFTLVASGDGAGGTNNYSNVTDLVTSWNPNMFLYLGDVYQKGTATEFLNWYGTSSTFLGRLKGITNPVIGNHEYENGVAPGYFDYWDNIPDYYSYDVAGWHFIALNSNCGLKHDCAVGQTQYQWLLNDLNTHNNACTVAYFHHPPFNVGPEGYTTTMDDMWSLMYQHGVDIAFTGHDHNYQRWVPLNGSGAPAADGITEFVVGAGGQGTQTFVTTDSRLAVGFDASPASMGALRLQLNQDGASYQYINYQGLLLDSGAIHCSGAPVDTTLPSTPANLTASVFSSTQADLAWNASTDNVGVVAYDIFRNGLQIASVAAANSYRDSGLIMGASYSYQVKARDVAGNISVASNSASLSMPSVLFSDGFESGNLSAWTANTNLLAQTAERYDGAYSVRATSSGASSAFATRDLAGTSDLYYSLSFKIHSLGTTSAYLQRFRTSTNASIAGIFVAGNTGKLGFRNDVLASSVTNGPVVSLNAWHQLQTHLRINGTSSQVEVWLDGLPATGLNSTTASLGTAPITRIQLGDSATTDVYDISLDDVVASNSFINTIDSQAPSKPTGLVASASAPNSVSLSWTAASDNISVNGYDIYRNNTLLASPGIVTSYVDTSVSPVFTYQYQVLARDAAGNVSALSAPASVTTPADTTPPVIALTAPADGLTVSGSLFLAADASDNVAIGHVDFLVNGVVVATQEDGPYAFAWNTTSVPDGTLAVITARAVDTSTNTTVSLSRSVTVNNSAGDSQPPSDPGNFSVTAGGASRVDLSWSAATDNIGVVAYDIYRNTSLLASAGGAATGFSDTNLSVGASYQYQVQARDAAGNLSALVSAPAVTVPAVLFADGFETGDLAGWANNGVNLQQTSVLEGAYALHAGGTGAAASYASRTLGAPLSDLYYSTWFKLNSQGATSAYLQRFRTGANGAILGVFVSSTGKLGYRNDVASASTTSTTSVSQGSWHQLQTHVLVNGASSQVEVWLDGTKVPALSKTDSLGTLPIGRIQLGDSQSTDVYDTVFDEVTYDTSFVLSSPLPYTLINSGPLGLTSINTADFSFSAAAAGASFECSLDGVPFTACASPQSFSAVADGSHTFAVRAIDALARVDATPASHTWTVDTTPPQVPGRNPADGAIDIGIATSVEAFFSEPVNPTSVTGTSFNLALQGSGLPVAATVSYDPLANKAVLVPSAPLDYLATYTASLKGGLGGVTDLAGNPLAGDVTWSFTTVAADSTPPTVSLASPLEAATLSGIVTLSAAASDNVGVTQVDFLVNGTLTGSDTSAPFSFDWNTGGFPNGPASLTAQARDARANLGTSIAVNVTVANDVTPPSVPANLAASAVSGARVDLSWTAASDYVGVAGYDIFRNGVPLASIAASTSYSDTSVSASVTYQYQVRAWDAAGNVSALSAPASASTPGALFTDHFESGDLSRWSTNSGVLVQQQEVYAGAFAARATTSGALVNATYSFPTAQYDLYYDLHFKIISQDPANSVYLLRFRKADTFSAAGVFVSPTGKLGYRNDIAGTSFTSTINVSQAAWHAVQAHVSIDPAGGPGLIELWYDGAQVASQPEPLSNAPVARIQLGDSTAGRIYDIAFDSVSAANFYINPADVVPPSIPANLSGTASSANAVNLSWDPASDNVGVTGYDIYRDGVLATRLGNVTSFIDTGLTPNTTYQYQVRALDAAENASAASAALPVTTLPDSTPPLVSLTSPAGGASLTGTINLAANATDNIGVARVEFLVNGTLVNSDSNTPYAYAWDSSSTPDGLVTITARAVDTSNNAALSAPVNVTLDHTAPDTSITSGPAAQANTNSASFVFAASEANVSFACSLDGAAFSACSSPAGFTGLLDGAHTFRVFATDLAGNADATPAAWNWTSDTVLPTVITVSPANATKNISPLTTVTARFSEAINPATLTTATFTLRIKQNGSSPLAATLGYDATSNTATLTTSAALASSTTYLATVKGGAGGVKDLAGNAMSVDNTWQFTTGVLDSTPPSVSVSAPSGGSRVRGSVTLAATASDNVAVASVDFLVNGSLVGTDTSSPYSLIWNSSSTPDGLVTITARATDTSSLTTTSTGVSVTLDNTAPNTTITSGPSGTVGSTTASFSFTSTEAGTFACSLDGAAFSACATPLTYNNLSSATHTFQVRAIDSAGNIDPTPASQSWTVDANPPDTTLTAGPSGTVQDISASFSFTSTKSGSTFACKLDAGAFTTCSSPATYGSLANGSHTFQVRATDAFGNTDATPASRTWTVDTTPPTVGISAPGNNATVSGQVTITASASDNVAVFLVTFFVDGVQIGTDSTAPYSLTWNTNKVAKTTHTIYAQARDTAGNITQSASVTVTVK